MRRFLPLLVGAVLVAGCGGDDESESTAAARADEPETVTVELAEVEGSGISGSATLAPRADKSFDVAVRLTGAGPTHPAHIHDVTCAEYAAIDGFDAQLATVVDTLADVRDGASKTTVGLTELAERTTGGYAINVHAPASPFPVVACGDIPKR